MCVDHLTKGKRGKQKDRKKERLLGGTQPSNSKSNPKKQKKGKFFGRKERGGEHRVVFKVRRGERWRSKKEMFLYVMDAILQQIKEK